LVGELRDGYKWYMTEIRGFGKAQSDLNHDSSESQGVFVNSGSGFGCVPYKIYNVFTISFRAQFFVINVIRACPYYYFSAH
jgi:hypothetical protein